MSGPEKAVVTLQKSIPWCLEAAELSTSVLVKRVRQRASRIAARSLSFSPTGC